MRHAPALIIATIVVLATACSSMKTANQDRLESRQETAAQFEESRKERERFGNQQAQRDRDMARQTNRSCSTTSSGGSTCTSP